MYYAKLLLTLIGRSKHPYSTKGEFYGIKYKYYFIMMLRRCDLGIEGLLY
jgi:hypothetical protein